MIYRILPDVDIEWKDVWVGAIVTSILFTIGKQLIGIYLGYSSSTSVYGAAGSLIIILLWVYYSAQIFFLGAEFTKVYAQRHGSKVQSWATTPAGVRALADHMSEAADRAEHQRRDARQLALAHAKSRQASDRSGSDTSRAATVLRPEPSRVATLIGGIVAAFAAFSFFRSRAR
jgi:membrane protein